MRSGSKQGSAAAGLVALGIGLGGCGETVSTGAFSGEGHAVAQRISDFQSDATVGDQRKLCEDDLAATLVATLKASGSSCRSAMANQLKDIEVFSLTIKTISVKGPRATARVQSTFSGKTRTSELRLLKERTGWRIAGL